MKIKYEEVTILDTENLIVCTEEMRDLIDNVSYVEGTIEELSFVTDYVEITRCLQEIYQWYQIIKFNLYYLKIESASDDVIAVNSYVIGLLGAGKSFIDLMTDCMKRSYGSDSAEYIKFMDECVTKEYDDSFSYRFLLRLRNFSQHCHIPISYQHASFCFDLAQIYNTPHYNFNKKVREQAENLMEDVLMNAGRNLTLAIEPTVASYICSVYKIFKSFLKSIRPELINKQMVLFKVIEEHPELLEHTDYPDYEGVLFYLIEDAPEILHAISTLEDPQGLLSFWLNDVVDAYKEETKTLKKMIGLMEPI